jgi:hypothetical protein
VHVWATDIESADPATWFVHRADLKVSGATFTYQLPPGYAVTFSTTTGQGKGRPPIPPTASMPRLYSGAHELPAAALPVGEQAPLLSAQDGAFEYGTCGQAGGLECVQQEAIGTPIWWHRHPGSPYAVLGDRWRRPYTVAARVSFTGASQTAGVIGDFDAQGGAGAVQNFDGYELELTQNGAWHLVRNSSSGGAVALASGRTHALALGSWHALALSVNHGPIQAKIDGRVVGEAANAGISEGLAGIMTGGFYNVRFRDLTVRPG